MDTGEVTKMLFLHEKIHIGFIFAPSVKKLITLKTVTNCVPLSLPELHYVLIHSMGAIKDMRLNETYMGLPIWELLTYW